MEAERKRNVVLNALAAATRTEKGAVRVKDVLNHMPPGAEKQFSSTNTRSLSAEVSRMLVRLCELGKAVSPGIQGTHRLYAAVGVLQEEIESSDTVEYRSDTILEIVRMAVERLGRGVRVQDVVDEVERVGFAYTRGDIRGSLAGLIVAGKLIRFGRVRARRGGKCLYIPAGMHPSLMTPTDTLSFTDRVAVSFEALWGERLRSAARKGGRPLPISAAEVAEQIASDLGQPMDSEFRERVSQAFKTLRGSREPFVKAVQPGAYENLFIPATTALDEVDVDTAFPNDTSRVLEAVRRAAERHGRPIVSQREIHEEVRLDQVLCPRQRKNGVHGTLSSLLRVSVVSAGGASRIRRQGYIANVAYYGLKSSHEADAWFRMLEVESGWKEARIRERSSTLSTCVLATVAEARAARLARDLDQLDAAYAALANETCFPVEVEGQIELRRSEIDASRHSASAWSSTSAGAGSSTDLPSDVGVWVNLDEAQAFTRTSVPQGRSAFSQPRILAHGVRRRFDPDSASEGQPAEGRRRVFLYDRFELAIRLARRWGGPECFEHAGEARRELGELRDMEPVVRALKRGSLQERLVAVSCLAFLCTSSESAVVERLGSLALTDREAGVRVNAGRKSDISGGRKSDSRRWVTSPSYVAVQRG